MPRVHIIQKPKFEENFDHEAIAALGEPSYMLPAAPNVHDQKRIDTDIASMVQTIDAADAGDIFISLGGSPLSQMMFGAALARSAKGRINYGMYSRARDRDGRRGPQSGQKGSYRIIPVSMQAEPHN